MKITNLVAAVVLVAFLLTFLCLRFQLRPVSKRYSRFVAVFAIVVVAIAGGGLVSAQVTLSPGANPAPLNNITSVPAPTTGDPTPAQPPLLTAVAQPSNLADFVQDETALLKLGKSLFWDMQLGSDGIQSCASCHFHAGADNRSKNQISPGLLASVKDITFQVGGGANYQLTAADFPFHKLADPNNRDSTLLSDANDIASSQGVFHTELISTVPGQAEDNVTSTPDPDGFQVNGINVRRVEPRNTPTVINTIFNKLQFWDGRAKETFNGVNTEGAADSNAKVYKASKPNTLTEVAVALNNSSLASLVTGPLVSPFETSANGRVLREIGSKFLSRAGKKLHTLRPLAKQVVHPQDGVLGADSRSPQPGLNIPSYDNLIKQVFKKEWWQSNKIIQLNADGSGTILQQGAVGQTLPENQFELRDWNFSLFAGLAMQKYISTLVSDQTPFDKFQAGNINALTEPEKSGLSLFVNTVANGGANCNTCHTIPEFTRASVRRTAGVASTDPTDPLINNAANGFFANYGIRPASDDPGAGNTTRSLFKAPALRNIALSAPYMHNGGMATLEQVVDFYNRGRGDDGGPGVGGLNLSDAKKADLVTFLRTGLTDQRVLLDQAPFDHPQLFVPNGHPGNQFSVTPSGNTNGTPTATDELVEIPAVGQNGLALPRPNFLE
ncbi:cytochrome C peroxidase [Nostoc sp. CHAB 5836]|uniref:cytochrome-c peroxidase n=1 Tax=Nostoc sp. CHAB 5836 TaxID=2780404 RepID=UPI001E2B529D|nr:cytochrome c peroxidase [Nostoc sp. CHAB 5836]MCC5617493.1 cytochrome C peroxidase [Nostoc sp. CHAB 5836]